MQIERGKIRIWADGLAAAVAAILPWSTSGTLIAIAVWLIVLIPSLRWNELRDTLRHPAAWLPVALFALAAIGMLWADVPWKERFAGLYPFSRLLLLPLLFVQFRDSDRWRWVLAAFLLSCAVLLAISYSGILIGGKYHERFKDYGVPVRDYIAQAGEFTLCAMGMICVAMHYWSKRETMAMFAAFALAILFLFNVVYVAPSRTALVTVPILLAVLAVTQFRLTQAVAMIAAVAFVCGAILVSSTTVQQRLLGIKAEVAKHRVSGRETSAGLRVEFWQQAEKIMRAAPVIGHGTGTVRSRYQREVAAEGQTFQPTVNPHNQTFMVAIQLGAIGALILIAMWIAQFGLFARGAGLAAWIGLAIVTQNIVGGLFNTHLFDFVQGWLYIFGVGATGGAILAQRHGAADQTASTAEVRA